MSPLHELERVTGIAGGGLAGAQTGLALETFYVDARGRAYCVPQQLLLAASVADLEFALAGIQPLPSLQVVVICLPTYLQPPHKPMYGTSAMLG